MGKGDKKTKRGKIAIGSFGVSRPHHKAAKVEKEESAKKTPKKKSKK